MLIKRNCPNEPDGKTVELGGVNYHFKPDRDGDNVAEVKEKAHLSRLLGIDEGEAYAIKDPTLATTAAPVKPTKPKATSKDDPFANPKTEMVDGLPVPTEEELARGRDESEDTVIPVPKKKAAKPQPKKSAKKA